uniref:Uncharacterized protein n=1 Tax=Globisporangium ultimum (strain ATCC 200006 / CBS 805.95 / DAOM BR144) TaxID=431595 RepID=K3WJH0_GLOUD
MPHATCSVTFVPRRPRARSQSPVRSASLDEADVACAATSQLPKRLHTKRATSYPSASQHTTRRICIQYHDEALQARSKANVKQMIQSALSVDEAVSSSTSARIARKALTYRHVLEKVTGVDVHDPTFDPSAFLGVEWCKTDAARLAGPRRSYTLRQM